MKTAEIIERIAALKARRKAVILAHNYQRPEIQDAADFVGDSLELSRCAANTDAEVIVFCGVHFMAETAAILCPDRKVLLPDPAAGCPMADMVTPEGLRAFKRRHPGAVVACYVNSSAAVKAESDVCCTSANAARVVLGLGKRKILFVPDRYLGAYVRDITGRNLLLWPGFCPTHMKINRVNVLKLKHRHPGAHVVVHPECRPEVRELADAVLSTGGICRYAGQRSFKTMIVGTEMGILHRLRKENPHKTFVPASMRAVCPNMKRTTLEKVLRSLETLATEITVPEEIRARACRAVEKMLTLTEHGGADRRFAPSIVSEAREAPPAAVQHGGNPSR
jgi:quinolinate synthase